MPAQRRQKYPTLRSMINSLLMLAILMQSNPPIQAFAADDPPGVEKYIQPGEKAFEMLSVRLDGKTYRIFYFTTDRSQTPQTDGGIFYNQTEVDWQRYGIQALLVLDAQDKPVIDEALLRRVFLTQMGGFLQAQYAEPEIYAPVHAELLARVSYIVESGDFQALMADKKAMSWLTGESDQFWYEETLRLFLVTPDAVSPAMADFSNTVRDYVQEGASWQEGIDRAIEVGRFANDKAIRQLAQKARKLFGEWEDLGSEKAQVGKYKIAFINYLDLGVLLLNLVYLQQLSLERAEMLDQARQAARDGAIELSRDLQKAIERVVAEARDPDIQRFDMIVKFVADHAAELGVSLGMEALKDIFVKWTWQTFGTRVTGHLVAGSFSMVLLAFPVADILFGREGIYENSYLTQYAARFSQEIKVAIEALGAPDEDATSYDEQGELYRNLLIWCNLGSAQIFRSWANTIRSARMIKWLADLFGQDWEGDAQRFTQTADQADLQTRQRLIKPEIVEYAIVLALARASLGLEALTATVFVVDTSNSMNDPEPTGGTKIDGARRAMTTLLRMVRAENRALGPVNQFAMITFNSDASLQAPMGVDTSALEEATRRMGANGGTNAYDALTQANQLLSGIPNAEKRIIVFMSDGVPSYSPSRPIYGMPSRADVRYLEQEVLDGPVARARRAGYCLFVVGLGDPGQTFQLGDGTDYPQVDSDFLQEMVADLSCGEYLNARDTNDLVKVYVKFHHQSLGELQAEGEGIIRQDETTDPQSFAVPRQADALVFNVVYPGSQIDLALKDSQGELVDETYPGAAITIERGLVVVTVKEPRAGRWSYTLYGSDIPAGGEPYYVAASTRQGENRGGGPSKTTWILGGIGLLCCCGTSAGGIIAGGWYLHRRRKKQ